MAEHSKIVIPLAVDYLEVGEDVWKRLTIAWTGTISFLPREFLLEKIVVLILYFLLVLSLDLDISRAKR